MTDTARPVRPALLDVTREIGNEQIADVHWMTHVIEVRLGDVYFRELLGDFARRVFLARVAKRPVFGWLIRAGAPAIRGLERQDAITTLQRLIAVEHGGIHWKLTPDEALALATALQEAAEEPDPCQCGRAIEEPSQLTPLTGCAVCATRAGL